MGGGGGGGYGVEERVLTLEYLKGRYFIFFSLRASVRMGGVGGLSWAKSFF